MSNAIHLPARLGAGGTSTVRWVIGAAVAAVLIMSTALIAPFVPLVVVGAAAAIALAAFRPKAFVVVGLAIIVMTVPIERVAGEIGGHADEATVALSVIAFATRRLVTEGKLVRLPGTGFFIAFLVIGWFASMTRGVDVSVVAEASLIYAKSALYAFALAQLRWTERDLRLLVRFGIGAAIVVTTAGLVNLFFPAQWAAITTGRPPVGHIGPVAALNGPFQHPAAMSRFCAILAMGAVAYAIAVRSTIGTVLIASISTALSVLTLEVKSLLGLMAAYALYALRLARPSGIVAFVCLAPLAIFAAGPAAVTLIGGTLQTYVFQESARIRITTGGIDLANQYFPLGAGLGRWGSSPAATTYSPEYIARGFQHIFGLGPVYGDYLNDTQWPAIIGESGWIGGACFALAIVVAFRSLLGATSDAEPQLVRWLRIAGIAWMIILVVESIAAPVFVSTPSFPFLFLASGVIASIRKNPLRLEPAAIPEREAVAT